MSSNLPQRWKPGQSGNPSGRPKGFKGLAAMIQKETGDGKELIEFALRIFRGLPDEKTKVAPSLQMRWDAMCFLVDRGYGKAVTPIDLTVGEGSHLEDLDMKRLSTEELNQIERAFSVVERARQPVIDVGDE